MIKYRLQTGEVNLFNRILYQEALCCKLLKLDHVMEVVVRIVTVI